MMPLNSFTMCSRVYIITQFLLSAQSVRKPSVPALSDFRQTDRFLSVADLHCERPPLAPCGASSQTCVVAISDLQCPLALLHHFCVSTVSVQCQYSVSTLSVQCLYSVSTLSVQCQYIVSTVSVQCQYIVGTVSVHCQ